MNVATRAGDELSGRFVVDESMAGLRIDQFVARTLHQTAGAARRLIDAGLVRCGARPASKGMRLTVGMIVSIGQYPSREAVVVADPTVGVSVIYEDEYLVAVNKPGGVPSHPLLPGERGTAANAIVARFPSCAGASSDPREGGLGHRLDTGTSGVLIAARSAEAWVGLRRALGAVECEKRYLCEVHGAPPDSGRIDADIGRKGRRGRVVRVNGGRAPRAALTEWSVVARRPSTAIVEARLHAGRAHQVRAHLAAAGFPIVGDDRYGPAQVSVSVSASVVASGAPAKPAPLHLHAAAVRFRHPITGRLTVIEAPAPEWAAAAT